MYSKLTELIEELAYILMRGHVQGNTTIT